MNVSVFLLGLLVIFTITTLDDIAIDNESSKAPRIGISRNKKTGVPIATPIATCNGAPQSSDLCSLLILFKSISIPTSKSKRTTPMSANKES